MPPPPPSSHFTYAFIPADSNEPMQDIRQVQPEDLETNIGCLSKALNAHYTRVAPITSDGQREAIAESVRNTLKQKDPSAATPDAKMLSALAGSQTIDIVYLLPATKATNFTQVAMYVDDKGVGKGSPVNPRASAVCTACGMPTEVRGDAFVAKVWDDQEGFVRNDLFVADLQSDAPWVHEAAARNASRLNPNETQAHMDAITSGHAAAEAAKPPDLPLAERLSQAQSAKAGGTERFKAGELGEASKGYSEALRLLGPGAVGDEVVDEADVAAARELRLVSLVNLSMCKLRLSKPYEAINACDRAIEIDEDAGKAWFRRGQACLALQQYGTARKNFGRAAALMPNSREVRDEFEKAKLLAAEKRAAGIGEL